MAQTSQQTAQCGLQSEFSTQELHGIHHNHQQLEELHLQQRNALDLTIVRQLNGFSRTCGLVHVDMQHSTCGLYHLQHQQPQQHEDLEAQALQLSQKDITGLPIVTTPAPEVRCDGLGQACSLLLTEQPVSLTPSSIIIEPIPCDAGADQGVLVDLGETRELELETQTDPLDRPPLAGAGLAGVCFEGHNMHDQPRLPVSTAMAPYDGDSTSSKSHSFQPPASVPAALDPGDHRASGDGLRLAGDDVAGGGPGPMGDFQVGHPLVGDLGGLGDLGDAHLHHRLMEIFPATESQPQIDADVEPSEDRDRDVSFLPRLVEIENVQAFASDSSLLARCTSMQSEIIASLIAMFPTHTVDEFEGLLVKHHGDGNAVVQELMDLSASLMLATSLESEDWLRAAPLPHTAPVIPRHPPAQPVAQPLAPAPVGPTSGVPGDPTQCRIVRRRIDDSEPLPSVCGALDGLVDFALPCQSFLALTAQRRTIYSHHPHVPQDATGGDPQADSEALAAHFLRAFDHEYQQSCIWRRHRAGHMGQESPSRALQHLSEQVALMIQREQEWEHDFVAFYHSYNSAAVLYEVHAVIARALYKLPTNTPPLPRLLRAPFDVLPSMEVLLKEFSQMRDRDETVAFRNVAICVSNSLFATSSEAPPIRYFNNGYCIGAKMTVFSVLVSLLHSCGLAQEEADRVARNIITLSLDYLANANAVHSPHSEGPRTAFTPSIHASPLASASAVSGESARDQYAGSSALNIAPLSPERLHHRDFYGHTLQIFVRKDIVDQFAYPSMPFGQPAAAHDAVPFSQRLLQPEAGLGQARVFMHPERFLQLGDNDALGMGGSKVFHYSASPAYNSAGGPASRPEFLQRLERELAPLLGSKEALQETLRRVEARS